MILKVKLENGNWLNDFKLFLDKNPDLSLRQLRVLSDSHLNLIGNRLPILSSASFKKKVFISALLQGQFSKRPSKFWRYFKRWRIEARRGLNKINAREFFLGIVKYFYRQGLSSKAAKLVNKILFDMYLQEQQKGVKLFSKFFRKLIKVVDSINVPLKLVPRFIKRRVRKVPKFAPLRFQRARTWRTLSLLGKNAIFKSEFAIAAELNKLYANKQDSILISKLPQIYKDLWKGRIFLRKKRRVPDDLYKWNKGLAKRFFRKLVKKGIQVPYRFKWRFISKMAVKRARTMSRIRRFLRRRREKLMIRLCKANNFGLMLEKYLKFFYGYEVSPRVIRHA